MFILHALLIFDSIIIYIMKDALMSDFAFNESAVDQLLCVLRKMHVTASIIGSNLAQLWKENGSKLEHKTVPNNSTWTRTCIITLH